MAGMGQNESGIREWAFSSMAAHIEFSLAVGRSLRQRIDAECDMYNELMGCTCRVKG